MAATDTRLTCCSLSSQVFAAGADFRSVVSFDCSEERLHFAKAEQRVGVLAVDPVTHWQECDERLPWLRDDRRLPTPQGVQCSVLRLMSGKERVTRQARVVSKSTALLVDALQSVGDFGQHREEYPESVVTTGFAASVVLTAIELVESLCEDTARGHAATG